MTAIRRLDRRMTVEEFLAWDSGDDAVWELVDGYPVLRDYDPATGQAAPSPDHGAVIAALGRQIGNRLAESRRPCRVEIGSGIDRGRRDRDYRVPDLMVRCGASRQGPGDPVLVVEVLSPANSASEMNRKHAFFKSVPGIREIVEMEQDEAACTILRLRDGVWVQDRVGGLEAVLRLDSIDADIPLGDIYQDILPSAAGESG